MLLKMELKKEFGEKIARMKNRLKIYLVVIVSFCLLFTVSCSKKKDTNFNKIKLNMTKEQVYAIMGREDEVSELTPNFTTDTYYWFVGAKSIEDALDKLKNKGIDTKFYSVVFIYDKDIVVDMASGYIGKDYNESK
jgi:hypothetical protein